MHVYTPPGYEAGQREVPGLVPAAWRRRRRLGLEHDRPRRLHPRQPAGGEEGGADDRGDAQRQLAAAGEPAPIRAAVPRPPPRRMAAMEAFRKRFTDELLKDVVPYVEKHYRVKTGQENRALAGCRWAAARRCRSPRPTRTSSPTWASGAARRRRPERRELRDAATSPILKNADHVNKVVKLFSISVGDKDFLLNGSKSLAESLEKHGIKHELHISGGGHTWINWRHYLERVRAQAVSLSRSGAGRAFFAVGPLCMSPMTIQPSDEGPSRSGDLASGPQ